MPTELKSPAFRYDAFLSYAHANRKAGECLYTLLSRYWVPGKKRRTIFMDRYSISAGVLSEEIRGALRDARFLIVCCSPEAVRSQWVSQETREFLQHHPVESVLACSVGSEEAEPPVPPAIESVEKNRGGALFKPDLRRDPGRWGWRERRHRRQEALSLLAPLVELKSKNAILDRRKKTWIISGLSGGFLSICLLTAFVIWHWWLTTPNGLKYLATRAILRAADSGEVIDDPKLMSTAEAFGRMGERGNLARFAQFLRGKDFRSLVLAAGYISLPAPDCDAAEAQLRNIEADTAKLWPRPFLLVSRTCNHDWTAFGRWEGSEPGRTAAWIRALAETGHTQEAQKLLAAGGIDADAVFPLEIAIGLGDGKPIEVDGKAFADWRREKDAHSALFDTLRLVRDLDRAGRFQDPASVQLLNLAQQAAAKLDVNELNNWDLFQELAVRLARAGRRNDALQLLHHPEPEFDQVGWAPGWAWRGAAWHELGDAEVARRCFARAEQCGLEDIPATRFWGEWYDIALAYATVGDWRAAFLAAEKPGDTRVRLLLRCYVLELWVIATPQRELMHRLHHLLKTATTLFRALIVFLLGYDYFTSYAWKGSSEC